MLPSLFHSIDTGLTPLEKETLIPLVIDSLYGRTKANQVTAKQIATSLTMLGYRTSDIRVRKMISCIVGQCLHRGTQHDLGDGIVLASGSGFWVEDDIQEAYRYIEGNNKRIQNIHNRNEGVYARIENLKHKRA